MEIKTGNLLSGVCICSCADLVSTPHWSTVNMSTSRVTLLYPSGELLTAAALLALLGVEVAEPVQLALAHQYLQSIGALHRVRADGAQNVDDLPQRLAADLQRGDVLERGALHSQDRAGDRFFIGAVHD